MIEVTNYCIVNDIIHTLTITAYYTCNLNIDKMYNKWNIRDKGHKKEVAVTYVYVCSAIETVSNRMAPF